MKQTLTYFSKTIVPQLTSGQNQHYGQDLQGIRVVDLTVKLGKIKSTFINEQHFDIIDTTSPEDYKDITIPGGEYDTALDWGVKFAQIYSQATGTTTTAAIDDTKTRLVFTTNSDKYLIQRTEPVRCVGHVAYTSFSDVRSEVPSPNIAVECPIPDGSYTPKQYAVALETALNVTYPGTVKQTHRANYDRNLDRITVTLSVDGDNNRYVYFNKTASEYIGMPFGTYWIYRRFGGGSDLRIPPNPPQQLNKETQDLSVMGYPFGPGRGKVGTFDKPYISVDGAYDCVMLCSNALSRFGTLLNGTDSNVLVVLPTMGVIQDWVKCSYEHRSWHVPSGPIRYNSLDFYITDASGHRFDDARFIVTLEIQ